MTDFSNIQISNEQAQQFARVIYTDVVDYVKNHQEEYKQMLTLILLIQISKATHFFSSL